MASVVLIALLGVLVLLAGWIAIRLGQISNMLQEPRHIAGMADNLNVIATAVWPPGLREDGKTLHREVQDLRNDIDNLRRDLGRFR